MSVRILTGCARDRLRDLPDGSVHTIVTSPPYFGLRDYGMTGQIGLEKTPDAYVAALVEVFRECRRVLRDDGTVWLNLGSSYARDPGKGGSGPGGKNRAAYGEAYGSAQSAKGGASGGTYPSLFPSSERAPAYDTDGTALEGSRATGFACSDPDGERLTDGSSHRVRNLGNGLPIAPDGRPLSPTAHDNGHAGSALAFPPASPPGADHPTNLSLPPNGLDVLGLGATASAFPPSPPPSEPYAPSSADTGSGRGTRDTSQSGHPSGSHTLRKASSHKACGCGFCGICWAYSAIPLLRFKSKDLISIPHLVAFALQADGWYLRSDIIWSKLNPMPESVTDRPTSAHEHIFLLSKRERYYYDAEAVKEPFTGNPPGNGGQSKGNADRGDGGRISMRPESGVRNLRNVWTVATQPYSETHFATFPPALIEPCIKAGCPEKCCPHCGAGWERQTEYGRVLSTGGSDKGARAQNLSAVSPRGETKPSSSYVTGNMVQREKLTLGFRPTCSCLAHEPIGGTVLDPFGGAGTTGLVADRLGRSAILIELNEAYAAMAERRIYADLPLFATVTMEAAE